MSKKNKRRCEKNASFFPSSVHWFFAKKHPKVMQNAWKPSFSTKIDKKSRVESSFLAEKRFLVIFWGSPGSPGASWNDPGNSLNRSFSSFMFNCDWKRRWTDSGRPHEDPRMPPGAPRVPFCSDFSINFARQKQTKKCKKCKKNNSKNLEELVTLMRATMNSW